MKAAAQFKAKGVDTIACVGVNDVFVMDAWGKSLGAADKVKMLADGNGEFARATGLTLDATAHGLGMRSQRFALVAQDGKVTAFHVEEKAGACDDTSAPKILASV